MSVPVPSILQDRYVGVAGDWHGHLLWAKKAIDILHRSGIKSVIHLGDFGLMGDIQKYLARLNRYLSSTQLRIFVVPGNHENYNWLNDDSKFDIDETGMRWVKPIRATDKRRIAILPRGYRWQQSGHTFMALGGASSIDFAHRTVDKTWWKAENITDDEVDAILKSLDGGHVDAMFTHDAPRDVKFLDEYVKTTADDWESFELEYAETSRVRLDKVFRRAQPKLLMHGHWHLHYDETTEFTNHFKATGDWDDKVVDVFTSRIVGLEMENSQDNLVVLDTTTLELIDLRNEVAMEAKRLPMNPRVFA